MVSVLHNKNFLDVGFMLGSDDEVLEKVKGINFSNDALLVAEVDTDSLDIAFELTNHIDKNWQENSGVKALAPKARSTSVGDIMIKDGEYFIVASSGFIKFNGRKDK